MADEPEQKNYYPGFQQSQSAERRMMPPIPTLPANVALPFPPMPQQTNQSAPLPQTMMPPAAPVAAQPYPYSPPAPPTPVSQPFSGYPGMPSMPTSGNAIAGGASALGTTLIQILRDMKDDLEDLLEETKNKQESTGSGAGQTQVAQGVPARQERVWSEPVLPPVRSGGSSPSIR